MLEIPITKGYVALVDDDDYERVSQFKWYAHITGQNITRVYAARKSSRAFGPMRNIYLHRFIMNPPPGIVIDHIDHNTLNCTRINMRFATTTQNTANNRRPKPPSGFRGVYKNKNGTWDCKVSSLYCGAFLTPDDAARYYDAIAKQVYGEFATLNFPSERNL